MDCWLCCTSALCGENLDAFISLAIHLLGQLILGNVILCEHLHKLLFYCPYSVYGHMPYLKPALNEQKYILMCASAMLFIGVVSQFFRSIMLFITSLSRANYLPISKTLLQYTRIYRKKFTDRRSVK